MSKSTVYTVNYDNYLEEKMYLLTSFSHDVEYINIKSLEEIPLDINDRIFYIFTDKYIGFTREFLDNTVLDKSEYINFKNT